MGCIPHFGLYSIFFWVMGYIQFGLYSIWVVYPILEISWADKSLLFGLTEPFSIYSELLGDIFLSIFLFNFTLQIYI